MQLDLGEETAPAGVPDARGYRCIVADCPWHENGGGGRGAQNHYATLATPDIIRVILRCPMWIPAPSAHLWLWVTDNFLEDGLLVMRAVGFRYVRTFPWIKLKDGKLQCGLGQYGRGAHELCLFGVRGRCPAQVRDELSVVWAEEPTAVVAPRTRRHSEKPEAFYRKVERLSPGPRLELFARARRVGWDTWGDDPAVASEGAEGIP